MARLSEDVLERIETKLDQMLGIAALQATAGMKQKPAIELLAVAGFDRRQIAKILNTSPNTVSVTLSVSRSKGKAYGEKRSRSKVAGR